jgi:hypothetical protein
MTKKIVVLSVSGLLFLSFMSWGWYTHENNRFYNHWVKKPETSLSVSAADLYNRFQKDRCRADKDYVDKVIEVTGTISDVQNNGSVVVLLSTSQPIGMVNCKLCLPDKEDFLRSRKGQPVTLKGKCVGFRMDVNLTDCIVK